MFADEVVLAAGLAEVTADPELECLAAEPNVVEIVVVAAVAPSVDFAQTAASWFVTADSEASVD